MSTTPASIEVARAALEAHLDQRYRALFEEVRHYPTPIAHCDDQLPWLIEQRKHALSQLRTLSVADSPAALRAILAGYPRSDDDAEMALVNQLRTALSQFDSSSQLVIPSKARNLLLNRH